MTSEQFPNLENPSLPFPLQADEQVLQLVRRHWWYLWPTVIVQALAFIVPVVVLWFLLDLVGAYEGTGQRIFWILTILYAIYWLVRIFLNWYRYHHDIWVITNQRIVDAYKANPFNLRVSSADLVNVQDIAVQRSGLVQTTLDFGDIICQTAGGVSAEFRLGGIPDPRGVQALIDQERDRERMRGRGAI
jgi:hypothetical protein